jgi:DNA ligase
VAQRVNPSPTTLEAAGRRQRAGLCAVPILLLALLSPTGRSDTPLPLPQVSPAHSQAQPPSPPDLMLAEVYEPGIDLGLYWVSEKLDGIRAYWDGTGLITRGGHLVRAPQEFTAGFPAEPLDGELWMGRGRFEELSGAVRREEPDPDVWRDIRYLVFDLPAADGPFGARLTRLQGLVEASASRRLAMVEQFRVPDHAALMERLTAVVARGGEGLMLHRDDAPYRGRRTDDLLKVKPYLDSEALVIAHVPGKEKYEGMLGALLVEDGDGRRFRIGTGFTDAQRHAPPPVGSLVTFKYQGRTDKGIPRFASFLRIRERE